MKTIIATLHSMSYSKKLATTITLVFALTFVHHIYGGIIYNTPWRIIMVTAFFIPMLCLSLFLQYKSITVNKKWIKVLFVVLVALQWIFAICIEEGGYNHVLKNILYAINYNPEVLSIMFPAEMGGSAFFEKPNDWIFEISGIVQFPFAFVLIHYLIGFLKELKTKVVPA